MKPTARQIKAQVLLNEYAVKAYYRATTWRIAAKTVGDCNPTAEMSIRVLRACMRDSARDAISRAKYALGMQEAA